MTPQAAPCPKLRGLAFALGMLACFASSVAHAQSRDERAVRAAYVYNLIKYVDCPAPQKDLTVAFAGDEAANDVILHLLDGRTSNGQTIRAVRWSPAVEPQRCSVLYIADTHEADVHHFLEQAQGRGVLTIGETEAFTRAGGMVGLVNTGDHIRIEVNLDAVQAAGIRISSRVLELAAIVRPAGKGGN